MPIASLGEVGLRRHVGREAGETEIEQFGEQVFRIHARQQQVELGGGLLDRDVQRAAAAWRALRAPAGRPRPTPRPALVARSWRRSGIGERMGGLLQVGGTGRRYRQQRDGAGSSFQQRPVEAVHGEHLVAVLGDGDGRAMGDTKDVLLAHG